MNNNKKSNNKKSNNKGSNNEESNNKKSNSLDKIIKNTEPNTSSIKSIDRFGCLDFECIISKISKNNKAYRIFSLYSNLIDHVCKSCDGYHFTCPEYICSADRPKIDIYKSYNKKVKEGI